MKKAVWIFVSMVLIFSLAACSKTGAAVDILGSETQTASSAAAGSVSNSANTTTNAVSSGADTAAGAPSASTSEALAANSSLHDDPQDYIWDEASEVAITLNGSSIAVNGSGVTVNGSSATIMSAGSYRLSGKLDDGQIAVNTQDKGVVRLILAGADLINSSGPAIYISNAEKVVLILADDTQSTVSDGSIYATVDAQDQPNAAIFSMSDLTIYGDGILSVTGNYKDGIASKDGLIVASGNIRVTAVDDGLRGKDYLVVQSGALTVMAGGDGLKSDNEAEADKGFITILDGTLDVTSGGDAIAAQTDVSILGGSLNLTTGGGSAAQLASDTSAKGIKGTLQVNIDGGAFKINSADDAVHSNGTITINNGTFSIASGDDGLHADSALTVNHGEIRVTQSYEGLESALITINDGYINVNASDDGINVATGMDGSGAGMAGQGGGMPGSGGGRQRPGGMGGPGGSIATFDSYTGSNFLYIHGGTIVVNASGDGLDTNGAIEMTGGVVLISGPVANNNGALDHSGFKITGGLLVAAGSAGMAQAPDTSSTQNSILAYLNSAQAAGTLVHIQNSAGEDLLTFAPAKEYQSLVFSSPQLTNGSYEIFIGGSSSGTLSDMLYQGGSYADGSSAGAFTVSGVVTQVGSGGRMR